MSKKKEDIEVKISEDEITKEINELAEQLEKAQRERDEYLGLAQRLKADFENLRKRSNELTPKVREDTLVIVVETLLPVYDTLLIAKSGISDANIGKGLDLIVKQFIDALSSLGITQIEALGKQFDYNYHDCIQKVKAAEGIASGTVIAVLKEGFILRDKVIRHSTVVIAE